MDDKLKQIINHYGVMPQLKYLQSEGVNDIRFIVGVPIPQEGTAYIYVTASEFAIELIGEARLAPNSE